MFNFQTMGNLINTMSQFGPKPLQSSPKKYDFPKDINDPDKLLQHLLDTNQVSQEEVEAIKANPMAQLLKAKFSVPR